MKLMIDIPEIEYNTRKTMGYFSDNFKILEAVTNGTAIPDNATNGDVIKILFADFMYVPWKEWLMIDLPWWNSPYQKGRR